MALFLKMCTMVSSASVKRKAITTCTARATCKVFSRCSSITTWNKDWKPGPYPRTKEERIAAAKKYNMIPEDYEPYPEVEGYGDYPNFIATHMENRDPFEVYDIPVYKRNFQEPMHPDFDICVEDKVNFQTVYRTPIWKQFLYLYGGFSIFAFLTLLGEWYPVGEDTIPKQYPNKGQMHYSFELDIEETEKPQ